VAIGLVLLAAGPLSPAAADGPVLQRAYLPLVYMCGEGPCCPRDRFEPNDDFATASTVPVGADQAAAICPSGDEDWYKFDVTAGEEISVSLSSLPANYDLELYRPSNVMEAESRSPGTSDENIVYQSTRDGEFRVRVYGYAGSSSDEEYLIRVDLSLPG